MTQTSDGSEGDLQAGADDAQVEVDKSQQNIEDGENAQEDSSNDQKIDSLDTESGSPDISNGKLSADEVNLRLRKLVTDDHRQQVIVSGVQASLPDMTALLEQAEEAQAQILKEQKVYTAQTTDATTSVDDEVQSTNGIFIDLATGNILFDRDAHTRINPASMTKVLTVLVAAEHVTDWSDTFEITPEITNYSYVHDCSAVGFSNNEVVTVEDLLYGTVLCSGGDAALGLATYVAGSQEAFVDMMNEKLKELGLSDTAHFTNCVGLYDENHYCTVYDIADDPGGGH